MVHPHFFLFLFHKFAGQYLCPVPGVFLAYGLTSTLSNVPRVRSHVVVSFISNVDFLFLLPPRFVVFFPRSPLFYMVFPFVPSEPLVSQSGQTCYVSVSFPGLPFFFPWTSGFLGLFQSLFLVLFFSCPFLLPPRLCQTIPGSPGRKRTWSVPFFSIPSFLQALHPTLLVSLSMTFFHFFSPRSPPPAFVPVWGGVTPSPPPLPGRDSLGVSSCSLPGQLPSLDPQSRADLGVAGVPFSHLKLSVLL